MHSTEDVQVPYPSFERLLKQAEKYGVNTYTFIQEGDEYFIYYEFKSLDIAILKYIPSSFSIYIYDFYILKISFHF